MYHTGIGHTEVTSAGFAQNYREQLLAVSSFGQPVTSRGLGHRELLNVVSVVHSPTTFFLRSSTRSEDGRPRAFNWAFGLAEAVTMLRCRQRFAWLRQFNEALDGFAEDFPTDLPTNRTERGMYGHYGERWRRVPTHWTTQNVPHLNQVQFALERLKADRGSRRAVISMWDPNLDLEDGHKDYPCNMLVHLLVRPDPDPVGRIDRLCMNVFRRSSDVVRGVPYDQLLFTLLLHACAAELKVGIGALTIFSSSLHLYDEYPGDLRQRALSSLYSDVAETDPPHTGYTELLNGCWAPYLDSVGWKPIAGHWWCSALALLDCYLARRAGLLDEVQHHWNVLQPSHKAAWAETVALRKDRKWARSIQTPADKEA